MSSSEDENNDSPRWEVLSPETVMYFPSEKAMRDLDLNSKVKLDIDSNASFQFYFFIRVLIIQALL